MAVLPNGDIGILYEGAGYATIRFATVPAAALRARGGGGPANAPAGGKNGGS